MSADAPAPPAGKPPADTAQQCSFQGATDLHTAFRTIALRHPNRVAISDTHRTLSYRDVLDIASKATALLRAHGVGPGATVALHITPTANLPVVILSVLGTGARYLPLDPRAPAARNRKIVSDARPQATISSDDAPVDTFLDPPGQTAAFIPDSDLRLRLSDASAVGRSTAPNTPQAPGGRDAYVIYTSGTTGNPKGVPITHRNVVTLLRAALGLFRFGASDVWLLHHAAAFDFSVWEIWGAFLTGARLHVPDYWTLRDPQECADVIRRENVTVLNQTPTAFSALAPWLLGEEDLTSLRYVIFGGERLRSGLLRPWIARHGTRSPRLVNMYGITEVTVHATYHEVTEGELSSHDSIIGRPLPGFICKVLDETGHEADHGELWLSGPQVARGYLNRPDITAERFRSLPWETGGVRYYRSGDLVERTTDGRLLYRGRADGQVKIRGHRVELGEVEAAVTGLIGIADAVVLRPSADGLSLPCLYATHHGAARRSAELRRELRKRIPGYMLPDRFQHVPEIPRNRNGKVDRKAAKRMLEG